MGTTTKTRIEFRADGKPYCYVQTPAPDDSEGDWFRIMWARAVLTGQTLECFDDYGEVTLYPRRFKTMRLGDVVEFEFNQEEHDE